MKTEFAIILGHGAFGAVRDLVSVAKAAALTPFVILNQDGADYSDVVPKSCMLKSKWVNSDNAKLVAELRMALSARANSFSIHCVLTVQDQMWLVYLELRKAFPQATGFPIKAIQATALKPNFRHLLKCTKENVRTEIITRKSLARWKNPWAAKKVIVKPPIGMGSQGVAACQGINLRKQVRSAARRVFRLFGDSYSNQIVLPLFIEKGIRKHRANDCALVEEYVDGIEYSVEGFANAHGKVEDLIVQEKTIQQDEPVFRDMEYTTIPFGKVCQLIKHSILRMLKITNYRNLPFHIELKVNSSGEVKPIEFNPRIGGGSISDLFHIVHNARPLIRAAKVVCFRRHVRPVFVTCVLQPKPLETGKLLYYRGLNRVSQQPDCVFLKKIISEGTKIKRADMEVYLVEFCIVGREKKATRERAAKLLKMLYAKIVT